VVVAGKHAVVTVVHEIVVPSAWVAHVFSTHVSSPRVLVVQLVAPCAGSLP
jgi:hypothetical protein